MKLSLNFALFKRFFLIIILIISVFIQNIFSENNLENIFLKRFPTKFHVKFELKLIKNTLRFPPGSKTKYVLSCAIPTTNDYHEVGNINTNKGEIVKFDNSDQHTVRIITENSLEDNIIIDYDITVYRVHVDLDKIRTIYPYDKESDIYKHNTGSYREIEPNHPEIVRLANIARAKSKNLLEYAKNAYIELKNRIKYKTTGNYDTLTNIFRNNGGDCAAHSKVLISLLRNKGIPARYITGGVIDKDIKFTNHVWVEFYLEKYGWIPADAAMTFSIPYIGYFNGMGLGFYRGDKFVQIIDERQVETGGGQNIRMYYRYWGGRPQGDYEYEKKFTITLLKNSNIDEEYNSVENITNLTQRLFDRINKFQKSRGHKEFTFSEPLSKELTENLKAKVLNNTNINLSDVMKKISYKTNSYWYWWTVLPDLKVNVIEDIFTNFIKSEIFYKKFINEISIGYYYNDLKGGHNVIVALTNPRK